MKRLYSGLLEGETVKVGEIYLRISGGVYNGAGASNYVFERESF